jgi:hypothetical protein
MRKHWMLSFFCAMVPEKRPPGNSGQPIPLDGQHSVARKASGQPSLGSFMAPCSKWTVYFAIKKLHSGCTYKDYLFSRFFL